MSRATTENHVPATIPPDVDDFLSIAETAAMFRVNQLTVRRMIQSGELPAVRLGARMIRVRKADALMLVRPYAVTGDELSTVSGQ